MLRLIICYLLLLSPAVAWPLAWPEKPMPNRDNLGPVLQSAVGPGWRVATTSGGYVLTSVKSFSLLPDVSSSSKANFNQRIAHARQTRVVIKILFTPPGTMRQFVSRHPGDNELPIVEAEKANGYFPCFESGDENAYCQCPLRDGPSYAVFLFANISPYESIHPPDRSDEYEGALAYLGRVFGLDPFSVIED
ncbi:MAG TPA: hypothetical protein VGZ93_01970 [Candidatus Methylacidiphilales bacterium]|jgi:hypothetical protein|nr:hypothetical protein [Candidatus Methylacidiphilales bacterium]